MPKTTDAVPQPCALVEVQPGCTGSWYAITSEATTALLPEEVRTSGSMPVFGSATHALSTGKKEPITATFQFVYSETADETWDRLRTLWGSGDCEVPMCVRVTPKGSGVGNQQIYIGEDNAQNRALMISLKPPDFNAGEATPANGEFKVFGNYSYDTQAS